VHGEIHPRTTFLTAKAFVVFLERSIHGLAVGIIGLFSLNLAPDTGTIHNDILRVQVYLHSSSSEFILILVHHRKTRKEKVFSDRW